MATEGLQYPSKHDVLCGRGGKINEHPGNVRFRAIVEQYKEQYNLASNKNNKANISRDVVGQIYDVGGRFLKKDAMTNLWFEEDLDHALKKTSQALREGAPKIRARAVREGKLTAPVSKKAKKLKSSSTVSTRTYQRKTSAMILPSMFACSGVSSFDGDALELYNADLDNLNFFNDGNNKDDLDHFNFVEHANMPKKIKTANDDGSNFFRGVDPLFVTPSSTPPLHQEDEQVRDDFDDIRSHRASNFRRMNSLATSDLAADDSYLNEVATDPFDVSLHGMSSDEFLSVTTKMVEL
mmetsp:Transcript_3897/g.5951  ORF Transcript_3897/g.5951 Transcript_3897/m.5951 type:complete len:295 (-) Transcript_3897:163-1047(-)|eukprot:CAMPEP_0196826730 /NCGR_PEP_ID=MMETSP1362-20130617/93777_1 /TAXON_ID=163516 /ORGANISM="Leptocylindrus danicus, Strain CCMP1856" /LENGTH=294 /DNA_ID=CAMNT_0042207317 /DNA_START=784 /DNA_END=1668 /DNA_ORIENTATION=+